MNIETLHRFRSLPQRPAHAYVGPEKGVKYRWGDAQLSILISPAISPFTHMAAWLVDLPAGQSVDFFAQVGVDRLYYCTSGAGEAVLDGVRHQIAQGSFVHCGRGVFLEFTATTDSALAFAACCLPIAVEAREDLIQEGADVLARWASSDDRKLLGLLDREQAAALDDAMRGPGYVLAPHDGDSFWQADPTPGYVTCKLQSAQMPVHYFSVATQLLEPGAYVREHGHERACEMLIAVQGKAAIRIDGSDELDFSVGAAILAGPKSLHTFRNCGPGDFIVFAIATPSEIEAGLRATGVRRIAGEPRPASIPRNPETGRVLKDKYGFIIPSTQVDAQSHKSEAPAKA